MMELGRLSERIAAEREQALQKIETEKQEAVSGRDAQERFDAERERFLMPIRLVNKLMDARGYTYVRPYNPDLPLLLRDDVLIEERFRLKPSTTVINGSEQHMSMDLQVQTRVNVEKGTFSDFKLSLVVSSPVEPETVHYLTNISHPVMKSSGMPEDYGMRTYKRGERDTYEVSSSVPNKEEAEVIVAAIEEAAELSGVFLNDEY